MDWRGSSSLRKSVLIFEAPKGKRFASSPQLIQTDSEPVLSPSEFRVCRRARRGKHAHDLPRPIVPLFTGHVMQGVHVASITDQSVYLTDQLEI